jgi:hypothetical protein
MLIPSLSRSNFLAAAMLLVLAGHGRAADAAPADPSRARVEGVVVDEAGRPVEGAVVSAPGWGIKNDPDPVRTGRDGTFRMVLAETVAYGHFVVASSDNGARQAFAQIAGTDFRPAVDVRLVLRPSREVTIRVLDGQNKPVVKAFLTVLISVNRPLASAESDAAGVARFRLPVDAGVDQIVGMKEGVGFDYYENYQTYPGRKRPPLPAEVTLVLDGVRAARVQAADSAGRPVAGVRLLPWIIKKKGKISETNLSGSGALPRLAPRTDAQGAITFDWLPRDLGGGVSIIIVSEDYHLPASPYLEPARKDPELTARLFRNVPAAGRVTRPDGRPAAGILVLAEGLGNDHFRKYDRTAADGSYSFRLYPDQTYIVAVVEREWVAPSRRGIAAKEGQRLADLDFRLEKGTLLEGRVTVGPDKKPLANPFVAVIEQGPGRKSRLVRQVNEGTDGRYSVRLPRGTYQLMGPDGERQDLEVGDEPRIERNFELPRPILGPLHGLVVEREGGRPVAGALVCVESADPSRRSSFDEVADGGGRFGVERRWLVRAWVHARSPDGTLAGFAVMTADDADVKVALRPAATLAGRLVGKDGQPLPDVRVYCRVEVGPKEALAARAELRAQADREGRFAVGGVVPGSRCVLSAYTGTRGTSELKEVVVPGARKIDLGDVVLDLQP